jgi:hypothetical protein
MLAGRPDQLLNLLPGSETMGLLEPGSQVGGRELNRMYGLAGQEDSWGNFLGGMATDVLTDPLTYAGGWLGGKAGSALYNRLGPRYGADAAKLSGLSVPAADASSGGAGLIGDVLGSKASRSVLNEIPGGSSYLGAGAESLNLATPEGDVLKILRHNPRAATGIPEVDGVINPTRRVVHGDWEVNRVPRATQVGDESVYRQAAGPLKDRLNAQGIDVFDLKPEDVGLVGGKPTILDMGSIDPLNPTPFRQIQGGPTRKFLGGGVAAGAGSSPLVRLLGGYNAGS